MTNLLHNTGEKLKKLRKEAGLTQIELAKKSSLNINTISRIEKQKINPSIETIEKIITSVTEKPVFIIFNTGVNGEAIENFLKTLK